MDNNFKDKKILVMGLGLFGGGLAVSKYLIEKGAQVLITDLRKPEELKESLTSLGNLPVTLRLGEHRKEDFMNADVVIANPAVPDSSPYLKIAHEHNAIIDTEINIFIRNCPAPIIGITGSNGKSTTTSMINHIFETAGYKTWLGGNIGKSLLEDLPNISINDVVILELSSFQLERIQGKSPKIAVVTNLSPNHLDRHKTMENYAYAKQNLIRYQTKSDYCILNGKDPKMKEWESITPATTYFFGGSDSHITILNDAICYRIKGEWQELMNINNIPLPGIVNQENAMAATMAGLSWGIPPEKIVQALKTFKGLPHRLEFVGEFLGCKVYEDSDATTPESTIAAIHSFSKPFILIAGGGNKGFDYTELGKHISANVRVLILMGETAPLMRQCVDDTKVEIHDVANMTEAVTLAKELAQPNDILVLSPAATSFGLFRNFVERAEVFKNNVYNIFK